MITDRIGLHSVLLPLPTKTWNQPKLPKTTYNLQQNQPKRPKTNIEDITQWREDMNFMLYWQEQYLTSERSERVRY